ncbi:MAG: hypothetical protein HUJ97_09985 [Bacteroidales bacterium]|nr:hypothetical protein [Bacteroidales bacterium]
MQNITERFSKFISDLDNDITNRIPWGDLQVNPDEGFVEGIPITKFWTTSNDCFEQNKEKWTEEYNAKFISKGDFLTYFITKTSPKTEIKIEGAEEAYVCPCPASTLIMMQTKAKDALKEIEEGMPDKEERVRKRDMMKKMFKKILNK